MYEADGTLWGEKGTIDAMETYAARYCDAHGSEQTIIRNDSSTLSMELRGVRFTGSDFDAFEPDQNAMSDQLAKFSLHHNSLCSCQIECEISVAISVHGDPQQATLLVDLTLGVPGPNGGLDREDLNLKVVADSGEYSSSGRSGFFEHELLEIQSQLPSGVYIRACINCLYSDYSPYGNGAFGGMMCFKNRKSEYLKVKSKRDFFLIHDQFERFVQEPYLCGEFERRIPGTGYRG